MSQGSSPIRRDNHAAGQDHTPSRSHPHSTLGIPLRNPSNPLASISSLVGHDYHLVIPAVDPVSAPTWKDVYAALVASGIRMVTPIELAEWRRVSRERARQLLVFMEREGWVIRNVEPDRRAGERIVLDPTEVRDHLGGGVSRGD